MGFPVVRPRRLRRTPALRRLVAETSLEACQLILPVFVREGASEPTPISTMPGVVQHSRDSLRKAVAEAAGLGLGGVMLFGVPEEKDARGSGALDPEGILNVAIADCVAEVGDALPVMADLCLDEFTDHGHCGVLDASGAVDNDATLEIYAEMALAQAAAGVAVVGPSGMMDGQVGVVRAALDGAGHQDVVILAYSTKYASAFYGPFREAVDVPVAAYNISGEYAMVEGAAANGWIDRDAAILETLTSIRRAGADVILTYWAAEVAQRLL